MNNFSGVMKLAQLVVLLFLVSTVFGGYEARFQKGAARGGPGKSGIAHLGRKHSLNHVMRRQSQNVQEDNNDDHDVGDDSDTPEDGDEGDGDKDNDDEGNGDGDNGDEGNDHEDNGDEDSGTRKYGLLFADNDDDRSHANRIVGGQVATYGEFPWQVTVYLVLEAGDENITMLYCGGVIINEWWVLTAGHCVIGGISASDIKLAVGNHYLSRKDSGEAEFAVERIIIHPGFNNKENVADNDIALFKIKPSANGQGIQFTKYVQPARMPGVGTSFPEGTHCLISGWGDTAHGGPETDVLLKTDSPIVNQARCKEVYAGIGVIIRERTICAGNVKGGTGACDGDSGGGLVCKIGGDYILAGIVSSGVPCAKPDYITMFSLVPKFLPWISSNMQD